jgi:hypothetical protein
MARRRHNVERMTPDRWLYDLHAMLRPWFKDAGYPIPPNMALRCGFPKGRKDGQCWRPTAGGAGDVHTIFVTPYIDAPMEVAAVVAHEIIHTVTPGEHGGAFKIACEAIGLVMTSRKGRTEIDDGSKTPDGLGSPKGKALADHLEKLTTHLGPYPHKALPRPRQKIRAKTEKWVLLECPDCAVQVRLREADAEEFPPICPRPDCGCDLSPPEKEKE